MPRRCSPASRARPGHPLHGARAEPRRARSRDGGGRQRDRDVCRRPPKPSAARTSTRASTSRSPPTRPVCDRALAGGLRVRGYLSTAFGCPYEGAVAPDTRRRRGRADSPISACSKWRSATRSASRIPARSRACSTPCWRRVPVDRVALHFHDTRGTALANVLAALPFGISTFDASAGGLGGCPYAPGAAGNLATDDLIYMLDGLGIEDWRVAGGAERGVGVHRHEDRPPPAVALRASGRARD